MVNNWKEVYSNNYMRTVLIVSSYPLPKCGISRYTGSIIEVFDIKSIKIKTHTIHFTKKPFSYFISSYQLIYILLFSKLDTIHFQYTPTILGPLAPIFIVIARWKRVKVITTVHESLESYNEYLFFPLNYLFCDL